MKNEIAALAFLVLGLCSCNGKSEKDTDNLPVTTNKPGINDSHVMKYVTCSQNMINTLIAKGDSIYSQTDKYSMENLGMDNEEYNKRLVASYGDTIPTIVLFMTHTTK